MRAAETELAAAERRSHLRTVGTVVLHFSHQDKVGSGHGRGL